MPIPAAAAVLLAMNMFGKAGNLAADLYKQQNNRDVYSNEQKAYNALDQGYVRYLEHQGLQPNPNRSWGSYYGKAYKAQKNYENSWADTVGDIVGAPGRLLNPLSNSLYDSQSLTRIYNRL